MSAPTKGPFKVSKWKGGFIIASVHGFTPDVASCGQCSGHADGENEANAHLLAASWEMREALQAVHDWRGLCDANDLETYERIGEMFRKDTGMLRPGKDDARGYDREKVDNAWYEWTKKKNAELDARIRTALAKAQGEGR